ncbi:hypothetical protein ES703_38360 [subsurface metagenome]
MVRIGWGTPSAIITISNSLVWTSTIIVVASVAILAKSKGFRFIRLAPSPALRSALNRASAVSRGMATRKTSVFSSGAGIVCHEVYSCSRGTGSTLSASRSTASAIISLGNWGRVIGRVREWKPLMATTIFLVVTFWSFNSCLILSANSSSFITTVFSTKPGSSGDSAHSFICLPSVTISRRLVSSTYKVTIFLAMANHRDKCKQPTQFLLNHSPRLSLTL